MKSKVFQKIKYYCTSTSNTSKFSFNSDDSGKLIREKEEKNFVSNGALLLEKQILSFRGKGGEPIKVFSEDDIYRAIDGYDPALIIGRNIATVYKGSLEDRVVAIKTPQGLQVSNVLIDFFLNQVTIKQQINHKNVVKLYGCCLETCIPTLVHEFMCSNLFDQLHQPSASWISWKNRLRIVAETSYALSYMHCAASKPIVHRNIKSSSIFLDESHTAKLSNFGVSISINPDKLEPTGPPLGTLGYIDPEYVETSLVTEKCDVYSFGVVLVELLTGKKPTALMKQGVDIVELFSSHMKQNCVLDIVDPRLLQEGSVKFTMQQFCELTMGCVRREGASRPTMEEVVLQLQHMHNLLLQNDH